MTIEHIIKHIQLLKLKEHTKQRYLRTLVDLNLDFAYPYYTHTYRYYQRNTFTR